MTTVLGPNSYGKSRVRLVKVTRRPDRHDLRDLTVDVALEGDFAAAHTAGDNTGLLATDTMRNTVYALAQGHDDVDDIERFGIAPRRALRRRRARGHARARAPRRAPVGAAHGRRRAGPARVPARRAAATGSRPSPAARRALGRGRDRRPRRAQDHRLGLGGLPARRVHLAPRDRRPHHGHGGHRAVDLRRRPRGDRLHGLVGGRPRASSSVRRPLQPVGPVHAAPHGRGGARGPRRRSSGSRSRCRTSTTCCTTWSRFGLENDHEIFHATTSPTG